MPVSISPILFTGGTGDGKSACCNYFLKCLGINDSPFVEGVHSHEPTKFSTGKFVIIDTPGMLDTAGIDKDIENVRSVVSMAKSLGNLNSIVIVVVADFQNPILSDGTIDGLNLYLSSFGKDVRLGILYTRWYGEDKTSLSSHHSRNCDEIISRCHRSIDVLPFWSVNCHSERLSDIGVPLEKIAVNSSESQKQIQGVISWVSTFHSYSTANMSMIETNPNESFFSGAFKHSSYAVGTGIYFANTPLKAEVKCRTDSVPLFSVMGAGLTIRYFRTEVTPLQNETKNSHKQAGDLHIIIEEWKKAEQLMKEVEQQRKSALDGKQMENGRKIEEK